MPSSNASIPSPRCASANTSSCSARRSRASHIMPGPDEAPEESAMTPQERQLIVDLFERLAALEDQPRDPEAERAIREGLAKAPHALYPLVQSVLVQDKALKAADAHIQELEAALQGGPGGPEQPKGFLDSMRDTLFGRDEGRGREEARGSVPSVRPGDQPMGVPPQYRSGAGAPWGG